MRIAVFDRAEGGRGVGAVDGTEVVDLTSWVGRLGCCPLASFLARAEADSPPLTGERVPLDEVTLLPPSLGSNAPLCVGFNYADHGVKAKPALRRDSPHNPRSSPGIGRRWSGMAARSSGPVCPSNSTSKANWSW